MKHYSKLMWLCGCLFGLAIGVAVSNYFTIKQYTQYDGEGNELPLKSVTALVRSQYVVTTKAEDSIINKYFK